MSRPISAVEDLFPQRLLEAVGISRVARVTELDRIGIEVACAIRPEGHVLQVSQGKGRTFEDAARSAAYEAVELWAAEHPDERQFTWASANDLDADGAFEVWTPEDLGALAIPELWNRDLKLAWVRATRVDTRGEVWVPAQLVFCPGPLGADVGLLISRWTSNGMGAHTQKKLAGMHAVNELIERHALSITLPDGWSPKALTGRKLKAESWFIERVHQSGMQVAVFDVTPVGSRFPPVAAALLRDTSGRSGAVTAGYACRPTLQAAIDAAVAEAAQSRLTDIHGAREDVEHGNEQTSAVEVFFLMHSKALPRSNNRGFINAKAIVNACELRVAVVEIQIPGTDVTVAKVLSPDAQLSELLT